MGENYAMNCLGNERPYQNLTTLDHVNMKEIQFNPKARLPVVIIAICYIFILIIDIVHTPSFKFFMFKFQITAQKLTNRLLAGHRVEWIHYKQYFQHLRGGMAPCGVIFHENDNYLFVTQKCPVIHVFHKTHKQNVIAVIETHTSGNFINNMVFGDQRFSTKN